MNTPSKAVLEAKKAELEKQLAEVEAHLEQVDWQKQLIATGQRFENQTTGEMYLVVQINHNRHWLVSLTTGEVYKSENEVALYSGKGVVDLDMFSGDEDDFIPVDTVKRGIFKFTARHNGCVLFGFSTDIENAHEYNIELLDDNAHWNRHFQNSYNLYGVDNYKFEIVARYGDADLNSLQVETARYINGALDNGESVYNY